ncbi:hypothetical protein DWX58_00685 [Pseudoflavonifractor sp. AF19-9AC]|nr:hypothetical protein DWX58_00685 [Pseudoflavonifractor sp. AF19-9AC]
MVLFTGVCFLLAFVVRTRPVARRKAKVLYIRIDNADGGRAKMKSHPTRKAGAADIRKPHQKRTEGAKQSTGPRRAYQMAGRHWYATVRSPPARGGLSAVASYDTPLSASMEVIFWR